MEIVRFFLAGYTLQRIKFSRSQTSKRPGEAKQKTLQTSKKWLAAVLLASQTRLERATPGLGGSCSIQLSYWDIYQKYSIFPPKRIRTNCRLGGSRSILLSYGCMYAVLRLQPRLSRRTPWEHNLFHYKGFPCGCQAGRENPLPRPLPGWMHRERCVCSACPSCPWPAAFYTAEATPAPLSPRM